MGGEGYMGSWISIYIFNTGCAYKGCCLFFSEQIAFCLNYVQRVFYMNKEKNTSLLGGIEFFKDLCVYLAFRNHFLLIDAISDSEINHRPNFEHQWLSLQIILNGFWRELKSLLDWQPWQLPPSLCTGIITAVWDAPCLHATVVLT